MAGYGSSYPSPAEVARREGHRARQLDLPLGRRVGVGAVSGDGSATADAVAELRGSGEHALPTQRNPCRPEVMVSASMVPTQMCRISVQRHCRPPPWETFPISHASRRITDTARRARRHSVGA